LHTVIIAGGQAGLATGYFLKKADKDFIILDENKNIGDSWINRWDSLLSEEKILADKVVIATGANPFPYIPAISKHITPEIYQIHSSSYHNPESIPVGDVLVVGAATYSSSSSLNCGLLLLTFIIKNKSILVSAKINICI
jgi:cation diffusion facilitator CzcD-associated flavoprotein CzcO